MPGPIFTQLREQNPVGLPLEVYDRLWGEMQKLGSIVDREYTDFLSYEQGLITLKFLNGENIFGVLPTSGGKSFTFQLAARAADDEGLTIVISPLIALMKDYEYGEYFNSDLDDNEKNEIRERIRKGKIRLLYISPERLKSADFKSLLASGRRCVRRVVIDEAHCVVEWGYSFRSKYLHIAQEIEAFEAKLLKGEKVPILLLTATASPWLQQETAKNLRVEIPIDNFITLKAGADRPELVIGLHKVKNDQERLQWIAAQLGSGGKLYKKRGIIFSAFADGGEGLGALNASQICSRLERLGVKRIGYYHGQMSLEDRRQVQDDFREGRLDVIVATKAFGMGIDLPKLGFTIHFYPPLSLEEYWQEAGRGGRGMDPQKGEHCQCVVLYNPSDYGTLGIFPSVASFEKMLCTFVCVVQRELCFDVTKVKRLGRLRDLLTQLHDFGDIRPLRNIEVDGVLLERWELCRSANTVLKHIEAWRGDGKHTKQTRRLQGNLRVLAARKGNLVRVEQTPALKHLVLELNWFTEPDIAALEMADDDVKDGVRYVCFRLKSKRLTHRDMEALAQKVDNYRKSGYAKLDYVFDKFLKAKPGKAKSVILDYLRLETASQSPSVESIVDQPEKPIGGIETIDAYCFKCHAKRPMLDPKRVILPGKGRPALKDICPDCGTKLFRIIKNE